MYWLENDHVDLPKGQSLTLRYRVIVHAGNAQKADVPSLFETYQQMKNMP